MTRLLPAMRKATINVVEVAAPLAGIGGVLLASMSLYQNQGWRTELFMLIAYPVP
jgi:hypothetical protein